jgi:hypothetical protein
MREVEGRAGIFSVALDGAGKVTFELLLGVAPIQFDAESPGEGVRLRLLMQPGSQKANSD